MRAQPSAASELNSAILVELPSIDAELDEFRLRLDPSRQWGMRAHVTLLYPFLPPASITPEALVELADIAASASPFHAVFDVIRWFEREVAWLSPSTPDAFVDLAKRIASAFPGCRPYGGAFSTITPHATIGQAHQNVTSRMLLDAVHDLRPRLPLEQDVKSMTLMSGSNKPESWQILRRFKLGGPWSGDRSSAG